MFHHLDNLEQLQAVITLQNVNETIEGGHTTLHNVCRFYRGKASLEWLLQFGANPNIQNIFGATPLHVALACRNYHFIQALLDGGADAAIARNNKRKPLHMVRQNVDAAISLVKAYPLGVFALDKYKNTPLHEAALNGSADIALFLLQSGSIVDALDRDNYTPCDVALSRNHYDVCKVLIDYGAVCDYNRLRWFVLQRNTYRDTCLSFLHLRRKKATGIARNGRDVLRIIAQHIWVDRNHERRPKSRKKSKQIKV